MTIYKRAKGFYHYDFKLDGRRYTGPCNTTSRSQARLVESRARAAARDTAGDRPLTMTLDDAAGLYWRDTGQYVKRADVLEGRIERILERLGRDTLIHEISEKDIADYVAKRRGDRAASRTNRQKGKAKKRRTLREAPLVSAATVNHDIKTIRAILYLARDVYAIPLNPTPIKFARHMMAEPVERVRELTADEENRLMMALPGDLAYLVSFALLTGVRLANARGLTWSDVDRDAGVITMSIKSKRPGGEILRFPIDDAIRDLIDDQAGKHPIYVFSYLCKKTRAPRRAGERYPFTPDGWRRDWGEALKSAGIEGFRFHDLRHTFATRVVRETGNLRLTQRLLGHKDITTTTRYAHISDEDLRQGVAASRLQTKKEKRN